MMSLVRLDTDIMMTYITARMQCAESMTSCYSWIGPSRTLPGSPTDHKLGTGQEVTTGDDIIKNTFIFINLLHIIRHRHVFMSVCRHVLFAESSVNAYAGSSFPGLIDSTFEITGSPNESERWEIVKKHYSAIIFAIQSATSSLRDVTKFMPVV